MTSEEYWRMFHLVRGDIEAAIGCNSTYLTIHRLGAADDTVLLKYNREAEFWIATTYSLQTAFFMALGRVFDQRKDTYSIEDVVEQTIEHPGFFNKLALRERKLKAFRITGNQKEPDWLESYIAKAWEPTRMELEELRVVLIPHVEHFKSIYEPIRHQYFAHRGKAPKEIIDALFGKTVKSEMADILRFAYTVTWAIQGIADNASHPDLTQSGKYEELVRVYEQKTEALIKSLP